jgi:hypothetical protein
LQVWAGVSVEVLQMGAAHWVPVGKSRQAPEPLQVPSSPQVLALLTAHWVAGFGVCPPGTGVQVPGVPVSAHDMQVPVQAVLQQTPWAQKPDWQAVPAPQGEPGGSLPQLPPVQEFGETQSEAVVQVVLQAPVPHSNGSHICVVAVRQEPFPSQVCPRVSVEPVQEAALPHAVPAE